MANEFDYFPFYPQPFLRDTRNMNEAHRGAYMTLLCNGWIDSQPCGHFPDDDQVLADWAEVPMARWNKLKAVVMNRFKRENGVYIQKRMVSVFVFLKKQQRTNRKRAAAGGNAKALKTKGLRMNQDSASSMLQAQISSTAVVLDSANQTKPNQTEFKLKPNQTKGAAEVREVLKWAGVGGGWKRCGVVDGLTPFGVLVAAENNKAGGGKPGGLVDRLTAPGYAPLTIASPELVSKFCKKGRVASVCGHEVHSNGDGCNVSFSNHEIVIVHADGEKRIREDDLLAEQIEVCLDKDF